MQCYKSKRTSSPVSQIGSLSVLSAELRNLIYEYVFTPFCVFDEACPDKTELLKSRPPAKALLQVNRQIYEETKSLYKDAYRRYWVDGQFCLSSKDWTGLDDANDDDLNHVEHLILKVHRSFAQKGKVDISHTFALLEEKREGQGGKLLRLGWKESHFSREVLKRSFYGGFFRGYHATAPGEGVRALHYSRQPHKTLDQVLQRAAPVQEPMKRQIMAIRRMFVAGDYATVDEWCHRTEEKHVEGCVCYAD